MLLLCEFSQEKQILMYSEVEFHFYQAGEVLVHPKILQQATGKVLPYIRRAPYGLPWWRSNG